MTDLFNTISLTSEEIAQYRREMAEHLAWWWSTYPEQKGRFMLYMCRSLFYHAVSHRVDRVWGNLANWRDAAYAVMQKQQ